ncbi:hypothetical protein [Ktedonospora formicarum]|nr:hypothetical protein [Ktedonospora formicarum]
MLNMLDDAYVPLPRGYYLSENLNVGFRIRLQLLNMSSQVA